MQDSETIACVWSTIIEKGYSKYTLYSYGKEYNRRNSRSV